MNSILFWNCLPGCLSGCLLVLCLIFQDVSAQEPASAEKTADDTMEKTEKDKGVEAANPLFERLVPPDRNMLRRYDQAIRLIEANRDTEAAQLLGSILENPVDFFVAPDDETRTSNKLFGDLVLEKLLCLPNKAREVYMLQFETLAKRLLENAVQTGSVEGIQQVARLYFLTASGASATFLLGMEQFGQGTYESAMLTLQRLHRSQHDLTPFEPTLSLTLAIAQLRSQRMDDAKQTIEQFLKRNPAPKILLQGKELWEPKSTEEIIVRLESLQKTPDSGSLALWLERTGWLLGSGTPDQNPETTAQKPLLELLWTVPVLGKSTALWQINSLMKLVQKGQDVYIPAAQPLIVGNRLLTRGMQEITAVDTQTGKRLWTATEPEYQIPKSIQAPFPNFNIQRMLGGQGDRPFFRVFFWHDRITHQMSSDGSRLFTVDGHDMRWFAYATMGRQGQNLRLGKKAVEDPRFSDGNTLAARDVKTGKILWQVGKFPYAQKRFNQYAEEFEQEKNELKKLQDSQKGLSTDERGEKRRQREQAEKEGKDEPADKKSSPPANDKPNDSQNRRDGNFSDEEVFLGETWFLGAPLPIRGQLFTLGENGGTLRLIVLDAETGHLIRQQPIGVPENSFETDPFRKYYGLIPSASNGILLCPTGFGLVVALDATTAVPIWCFSYLEPTVNDGPNNGGRNRVLRQQLQLGRMGSGLNEEFRNLFAKTGWQVPALMIDGNRVLVAPPDDPALYCLDLATGKLLWQKKEFNRNNVLYVACIRNGTVYLVAPNSMFALDMDSGEPVWDFSPNTLNTLNTLKTTPSNQDQAILKSQQRRERLLQVQQRLSALKKQADSNKEQSPDKDQIVVSFPRSLKPGGIGVHNGNQYFLPLTKGYLGVIDLDQGTLELLSSQLLSQNSKPGDPKNGDELPQNVDAVSDVLMEQSFGENRDLFNFSLGQGTDDSFPESLLHQDLELGNLIGLQRRFFSQTPNQISGFDQLEPLKEWADARLQANPEDPEGLLQQGRIRRAEGNAAESIALFRRSLQARSSEYAADCLRKTLLEAIRNDYKTWASNGGGAELESLAEFPEELGEILFVLANGALTEKQAGQHEALINALQKVFCLEIDHFIQVSTGAEQTALLHRALGTRLKQQWREGDSELKNQLNHAAGSIFEQLRDKKDPAAFLPELKLNENFGTAKNQWMTRPWWERETTALTAETRALQVFTELFRPLPVSEQAKKTLLNHYEQNKLFTALEFAWNPPVDWLLPEKWATQEEDVSKGSTPKESTKDSTEPVAVKPIPPTLPTSAPDFEKIKQLAAHLESLKNFEDADYYYRELERAFGEEGKAIRQQARENPKSRKFYDRELAATSWPSGKILVEEEPQKELLPENTQNGPVAEILRAISRPGGRAQVNQYRSLPFLGSFEPFLSPFSYAMETVYPGDVSLVCYDKSGEVRWRSKMSAQYPDMVRYGSFNERPQQYYPYGFADQTVYLKGCNHLLLFVRDNVMMALDTFHCNSEEGQEPKVLWTKTLTTSLPGRQQSAAAVIRNIHGFVENNAANFPKESLFVSPQVVCYRDADRIYGLDPMTGKTLWTRQILMASCSILGDRNNLFLVFPGAQKAVAIDPFDGSELAAGTIPRGGIFTFETNIVFVKRAPVGNNSDHYQLLLGDLRELFEKRKRALVFTDAPETENEAIPSIPTYPVTEGLPGDSIIRPVIYGRFLASVVWDSLTLRIYDLQTRRFIFGSAGNGDSRTGAKLPEKLRSQQRQGNSDFEIELIDDKFLVYFTESPNINSRQTLESENGTTFRRRRNAVVGVQARPIGIGLMMLYDSEGNPCWTKSVLLDDWFQLLNVPSNIPAALFTVAFNDEEPGRGTTISTALMGIDKRTGKMLFRKIIPPVKNQLLQGFRIASDPVKKEISFLAPGRTVIVRFTDQAPPPPSVKPPETKPGIQSQLEFQLQDFFNLFQ